jgi:hypothetical protein
VGRQRQQEDIPTISPTSDIQELRFWTVLGWYIPPLSSLVASRRWAAHIIMHSFLCTASIPTHLFHHCQHPSNILFKAFMHSLHCLCTRSDHKLPLRSPASFIYYATRALDSLSLMMVHMLSSPFFVWIFNYSHHFLMQEVIIVEVESWEKYGCDILVDCKCNSTQRVHKIYYIYSIFAICIRSIRILTVQRHIKTGKMSWSHTYISVEAGRHFLVEKNPILQSRRRGHLGSWRPFA